jgi:hypothetical protein
MAQSVTLAQNIEKEKTKHEIMFKKANKYLLPG